MNAETSASVGSVASITPARMIGPSNVRCRSVVFPTASRTAVVATAPDPAASTVSVASASVDWSESFA